MRRRWGGNRAAEKFAEPLGKGARRLSRPRHRSRDAWRPYLTPEDDLDSLLDLQRSARSLPEASLARTPMLLCRDALEPDANPLAHPHRVAPAQAAAGLARRSRTMLRPQGDGSPAPREGPFSMLATRSFKDSRCSRSLTFSRATRQTKMSLNWRVLWTAICLSPCGQAARR